MMMGFAGLCRVAAVFGPRPARFFNKLWFASALRLCGIRPRITGRPVDGDSVLFVGNHLSYLDIPVLGWAVDARFIAKKEVGEWPMFGTCARVIRTVFIRRDPREALRQCKELAAHLRAGERMLLFPEGTSSDGQKVLPFKSTLFSVADSAPGERETKIQPFTIAYTRTVDGVPLTDGRQDLYTWHGDMEMLPHLMAMFSLKGACVEIIFHDPVTASQFDHRKELAAHCQQKVSDGLALALREVASDATPEVATDAVSVR